MLELIARGKSSKEIAPELGLSARTVDHHRASLMRKLGAQNAAELTGVAFLRGLVKLNGESKACES